MLKSISKNKGYSEEFIKYLIDKQLKPELWKYCFNINITKFSNEFNLNAPDAFRKLVNNIILDQTSNEYIITISDKKYSNDYTYQDLNDLFTWGSRTIKGYNIIEKMCDLIFNKYINTLYENYLDGLE